MVLHINQVKKEYGNKEALKSVSLVIPKGACYGLVGPNGAGKSTLLKIIASIILDYEGKVRLINLSNQSLKQQIGYVPQEICLEQNLSAISNLYFFGKLYDLKGKELKSRAMEVLKEIGLIDRAKDKVKQFSGGMKRRLNIGCALMHRPNILIMDEPTVGIDPQSRRYIFEMIKQLQQQGCTIIYATHYMEEVEQLCDEVAFIDHGEIIEQGRVEALLQRYATPSVFVKGMKELPEQLITLGDITRHKDGYLITTNQLIAVMETVLQHYQEEPDKLLRLEIVRPRLEDVFITLTGSELRDGQRGHV